jgi:hypothetical protein
MTYFQEQGPRFAFVPQKILKSESPVAAVFRTTVVTRSARPSPTPTCRSPMIAYMRCVQNGMTAMTSTILPSAAQVEFSKVPFDEPMNAAPLWTLCADEGAGRVALGRRGRNAFSGRAFRKPLSAAR